MRLRTLPPSNRNPRRRRILRTVQVLPTLMTAGNLMAGLLACAYMIDAGAVLGTPQAGEIESYFTKAAWLIFLGMFLDGLDGRVARMTRSTSAFGAQLDSLADVVTFGVAPALVAKTLFGVTFPDVSSRILFVVCLIYTMGAALRLARYNVESERLSREGTPHVTRVFRGLPSPAAAGVLAALLLLRGEYAAPAVLRWTEWAILLATPVLGLLMISRMPFSHVMNRYFDRERAGPLTVVILLVLLYLVVVHFIETVAGLFVLYALSGPVLTLTHRLFGFPAFVVHEDHDEDEAEDELAADAAEHALDLRGGSEPDPLDDEPQGTGTDLGR
ncbi:MAG: CDP-diacylglycerol--serine O-phosphatidyltransferase [Planctomycetota bacterium]|nr:CDP-diacylglycerol--serine O-phosphatidyltransferase [Planctomycetota bacterium]